jgi:hypothetical protein
VTSTAASCLIEPCRTPALVKTLLRAVGDRLGPLCLLLDAWYMRGSVIRAAMQRGHTVVGQVRRDTALFELPISQEKLPLYLGFFEFVHNARGRGKALLGVLIAALVR